MPGPGKFFIKVDKPAEVIRAWLFNFEVNLSKLKIEHTKLLDDFVVPVLREGGAIKLLGLASTTGTDSFNKHLSSERCNEVEWYLRSKAGTRFIITKNLAMGET